MSCIDCNAQSEASLMGSSRRKEALIEYRMPNAECPRLWRPKSSRRQEACPELAKGAHSIPTRPPGKIRALRQAQGVPRDPPTPTAGKPRLLRKIGRLPLGRQVLNAETP